MTIETYFTELEAALSKLSPADRQESLEFYREYAVEAGMTQYEEMAQHFGAPQALAANIYAECAAKQVQRTTTGHGGSVGKAFLIGLTALFALPMAIPALITLIAVLFALFVSVAAILFSFGTVLFSLGATAVALFLHSFTFLLPFAPALWCKSMGGALLLGAITVAAAMLLYTGIRHLLRWITLAISRHIKRRTSHE